MWVILITSVGRMLILIWWYILHSDQHYLPGKLGKHTHTHIHTHIHTYTYTHTHTHTHTYKHIKGHNYSPNSRRNPWIYPWSSFLHILGRILALNQNQTLLNTSLISWVIRHYISYFYNATFPGYVNCVLYVFKRLYSGLNSQLLIKIRGGVILSPAFSLPM